MTTAREVMTEGSEFLKEDSAVAVAVAALGG
jgi:hypothetical protein